MAGKFDGDWTKELSLPLEVESCPKHSGFTLDYVCKQCQTNVCVSCVACDHHDHELESLKSQKVQISEHRENLEKIERGLKAKEERKSELKKNLEKRLTEVKVMQKHCKEWSRQIHEITEEKLCFIDQESDRRRSSVILERNDFERRAKSMTDSLEKEENNIYALAYSLKANPSEDIQEESEECTSAQLPRVKTYNNLKVKFERMQSPNRFSSSSTTTLGELASSSAFEPSTSTCRRWPSEGLDREQAQGAVEMEHSKDASDLQGDMDTCSGSDCGELGAEGGLAFKIDREGVIKGQMKEDEKGNDAHSGKDDVVLSDLAMHLLPENLTPLGLRLGLSNIIINQIRFNNPLSIGNAIYQVLQEWKGIICAGCLTEEHFKTLEQCLRKIGHEDAADWLIERLHKSTDQLGQPSPSPGQLVQPASSDSQVTTKAKKDNYDNLPKETQSDGTDRVESTDHATEHDTPSPSTVEIHTETREHAFDDLLKTIAKQIHKNDDIDSLGGQLGFEPPEIQRYIQKNEKYHDVTCMGTLSMLRDWRDRTKRSEEHAKLKKALIAIKHIRLADDLLKDNIASSDLGN